jgi:hypothetical protein
MAFLWHGNVWTAQRSRKFRGSCSIANGQPTSAALNRGTRVPRGKQFRKVSKIDHTSGIGESILLHHRREWCCMLEQTKLRATGSACSSPTTLTAIEPNMRVSLLAYSANSEAVELIDLFI